MKRDKSKHYASARSPHVGSRRPKGARARLLSAYPADSSRLLRTAPGDRLRRVPRTRAYAPVPRNQLAPADAPLRVFGDRVVPASDKPAQATTSSPTGHESPRHGIRLADLDRPERPSSPRCRLRADAR